ncbi:MAG: energy transducer TonB [Nitrospira sp.]|nr:energy transducer TonB [Nitrospira sp.]
MTSMDQNRFVFPAWGISLTLHGLVVGVLFILAAQVKPVLQENLFQWDVALIESTSPDSKAEEFEPVQTPEPLPAKKMVAARTKSVPDASQPVTAVMPSEHKIEPLQRTIEQVPLSEEKVEVPRPREEPMEQRLVEMTAPASEPSIEAKEPTPQPVQEEPVSVASVPAMASDVVRPEEALLSAAPSRSEESVPAQVAKTSPADSEMKADHRWLAESLWRRVAELKRYPSSARMSGQEGKVILKAVIRSDGHLADVSIQRSSGHELLDAAAIEAVKLACPLHMKHALDKPQIVVSLPIVYSLLTP